MFKALTACSLGALLCLVMLPGSPWTPYVLVAVVFLMSIFGAAFPTAANRALLMYMGSSSRIGYTNVWLVSTSLSMGLTPILAGYAIDHLGLWGFRLCFTLSGVLGLACALACRWVVHGGKPLDRSVTQMLNPVLPIRVLARIVWITAGLHESSRTR